MTIDVLKTLRNDSKCNSNAQTVPVRRVSSVRRSLFGDVDHEKSMSFLKKELDAIAESQKKRWNFDFANEKPLHDSCEYEWTQVQADEIVPKPYALSRLPYLYEHTENSPLSSDKSDSCLPTTQQSSRLQVQQVTMSKTKLKQTLIDGYIKCRKRTSSCVVISKTKDTGSCSCNVTKNNSSDSLQCSCYHLEPSSKKQCLTLSKNPAPSSPQN